MKYLFFFFSFLFTSSLFAQLDEMSNNDTIYQNNIRTVRFHVNGLPVSNPIIDLRKASQLLLTFDDMDGDDKEYTYQVRHHNRDWSISDMAETDYIDGFQEGEIRDYEYAFNTKTNFTHYALMLPNVDINFLLSGNYTVTIYNRDTEELTLTRRFILIEPLVKIQEKLTRPALTEKQDTHHEFDFTVTHEQVGIKRPLMELTAVALQNGRWDNAITDLKPRFSNNSVSQFDYQDKVIFPAGLEYRFADIRSLDYLQLGVFNIEEAEDGYDVLLNKDTKRYQTGFSSYRDINGDFVIENLDNNQVVSSGIIQSLQGANANDEDAALTSTLRTDFVRSAEDYLQGPGLNGLTGDYANVTFSLVSPTEYYDDDVYIFGKLTDWKVKREFKLSYNDTYKAYMGNVLLKQGFHNYYYVRVPQKGGKPDASLIEGNWFETENEYTILIYYRSFIGRYDRCIGAHVFATGSGF